MGLPLEEARLHHDPILHKQVQPNAVELRRVGGRTEGPDMGNARILGCVHGLCLAQPDVFLTVWGLIVRTKPFRR